MESEGAEHKIDDAEGAEPKIDDAEGAERIDDAEHEQEIMSDMSLELGSIDVESDSEKSGGMITRLSMLISPDLCFQSTTIDFCGPLKQIEDDDTTVVERRPRKCPRSELAKPGIERFMLTLVHAGGTHLESVGRQLWRASLLLSEFVLSRPELVRGRIVIELGCGIGMLGVILRMLIGGEGTLFLTDRDDDILGFTQVNLNVNQHLRAQSVSSAKLRRLDWHHGSSIFSPDIPCSAAAETNRDFDWAASDVDILARTDVVFCSDCIYDEMLTEALFLTIKTILSRSKHAIVYLALEKRFNFELATLSVQAHGYRCFMRHLEKRDNVEGDGMQLRGKLIPLIFPACFEYCRVGQLELWEISAI